MCAQHWSASSPSRLSPAVAPTPPPTDDDDDGLGGAVTVRYLYPDPTNPAQMNTQNPLGSASTTYRWNGSRIVMEQALPAVALKNNC